MRARACKQLARDDTPSHLELVDVCENESALIAHKPALRVGDALLRQRRVPEALVMHRVRHMCATQAVTTGDLYAEEKAACSANKIYVLRADVRSDVV